MSRIVSKGFVLVQALRIRDLPARVERRQVRRPSRICPPSLRWRSYMKYFGGRRKVFGRPDLRKWTCFESSTFSACERPVLVEVGQGLQSVKVDAAEGGII